MAEESMAQTGILAMYALTLTFIIWSWVKVMTYPLVMDNTCINIIQIGHM